VKKPKMTADVIRRAIGSCRIELDGRHSWEEEVAVLSRIADAAEAVAAAIISNETITCNVSSPDPPSYYPKPQLVAADRRRRATPARD